MQLPKHSSNRILYLIENEYLFFERKFNWIYYRIIFQFVIIETCNYLIKFIYLNELYKRI